MKIVTGYSIWIKPQGNLKRKLTSLMLKLSRQYNTFPFFTPHITLYEDIHGRRENLIFKTSELAKNIKPFKIKLTKVDDSKKFNSLVILVKKEKKLMEAYRKAKKIFKGKSCKKYIPHLTLLLEDISKQERREIISKIGRKFNSEFEVKCIYLVPIGLNPKRWIPIKRFNLKNR